MTELWLPNQTFSFLSPAPGRGSVRESQEVRSPPHPASPRRGGEEPDENGMSLARAIATVGGFTLLSRIVGFVRDIVLSAFAGLRRRGGRLLRRLQASPTSSAVCSPRAPSSAAFVPLFARELTGGGREEAMAFARQAQAALLLVAGSFHRAADPRDALGDGPAGAGHARRCADLRHGGRIRRIAFPYLLFHLADFAIRAAC